MSRHSAVEIRFPCLEGRDYAVTSDNTDVYNCIAWALGESDRRWDPYTTGGDYWPDDLPRDDALSTFVALFEYLGFAECGGLEPEEGIERIAIYAEGDRFTHVARQLDSGRWTSKLGDLWDIEHEQLEDLEKPTGNQRGQHYGEAKVIMCRLQEAESQSLLTM